MKQKTYRIIYFRGDNLAKHEFGIIDSFEENKWYSDYEPEKYNCISVRDDLIEQLIINYDEELKWLYVNSWSGIFINPAPLLFITSFLYNE